MFRIILSIFVGIRMAVVDMGSHKLRSILSILGVLLGVASLVAMLTLVGGIEVFLNEKMAKWTGSVWFFKRWDTTDLDKYALSRSPGLRYSDGQEVAAASKDVKEVVGVITRGGTALLSGTQVRADFRGTTEHNLALDCESIKIREGRWFSTEEYLRGNRVCCISWEIEDQVKRRTMGDDSLKWRSLVGMRLSNGKEAFTVIGTYEPSDPDFKPWNLRQAVILPIRTMQQYVTGFDADPGNITIMVKDIKQLKAQANGILRSFTGEHRGAEDVMFRFAEWFDNIKTMLNNVSILIIVISVVSLLVGGLSIMNVMLSSISERVREIGIRKALGARNIQIFVQFIMETMTLSMTGGICGVGVGLLPLAFKEAIKKSTDGSIVPTILPTHLFIVFCIIVGVGILFGLYPALKAMRMNPVEALRYE